MRALFHKLLPWVILCVLAPICLHASSLEDRGAEPTAMAAGLPDGCGIDVAETTSPVTMSVNVDQDSELENIEIFQGEGCPPLARWDPRPGGRPRDAVWAVATHIIVKLKAGNTPEKARKRLQNKGLVFLPISEQTFLVLLPPGKAKDVEEIKSLLGTLSKLRKDKLSVEWAEPDYLLFTDTTPDPKYALGGFRNAFDKIQAPAAWCLETGSSGIKVAVIDTGADLGHPDLSPNLLVIPGANILDTTKQPLDDHTNSHGTYCAGLIGAQGNDGAGMRGVNWDVALMPIKAFNDTGVAVIADLVLAINFAISKGADVISASWGGLSDPAFALKTAIEDAKVKNILFVASAGDGNLNLDIKDYIPATYNLANMIVVGASDTSNDKPLTASGFGTTRVHLSAPGFKITSTWRTDLRPADPYFESSGTSASVALVAGAAALVKAKEPGISLKDLRCRILQGTEEITDLASANCSSGRLNVDNAVRGKFFLRTLTRNCGCS